MAYFQANIWITVAAKDEDEAFGMAHEAAEHACREQGTYGIGDEYSVEQVVPYEGEG